MSDHKRTTSQRNPSSEVDRYVALQRKVEELEKIHNDGKKAHQAEVDQLRLELARLQRLNNELGDKMDVYNKRKEALEQRVEELKRTSNADKAEIKDLGVKLRMSEHQRSQMTSKHGDLGDLKKNLHSLETRRKEEVKERDKKIAELEKSLSLEKKKREGFEKDLKEIKGKQEAENGRMKLSVDKLKKEIMTANDELQKTQQSLEQTVSKADAREEFLSAQLGDHQSLIASITEHYSLLSSSTISRTLYDQLKYEHAALQIHSARLTRKLGNTEGQVTELANLIRQSQEENQQLRKFVTDLQEEQVGYREQLSLNPLLPPVYTVLDGTMAELDREQLEVEQDVAQVLTENLRAEVELYRLQYQELLSAYAHANQGLEQSVAVAVKLGQVEIERDTAKELLQATTIAVESLKSSSEAQKREAKELEEKLRKGDEVLTKEKESVHRLATTIQKLRMAEEALRAENEQLTTELTEAEHFQEAYYSLSEELGGLLARNALAEDEAQRLSQVNAEILGHRNPAQRIMYVEKIRNELAETKQKLLASTRAHETATAHNTDLQNELDMYKSVSVPLDHRPGTKFTRMTRPPLVNLNKSTRASSGENDTGIKPKAMEDMTLDEIL